MLFWHAFQILQLERSHCSAAAAFPFIIRHARFFHSFRLQFSCSFQSFFLSPSVLFATRRLYNNFVSLVVIVHFVMFFFCSDGIKVRYKSAHSVPAQCRNKATLPLLLLLPDIIQNARIIEEYFSFSLVVCYWLCAQCHALRWKTNLNWLRQECAFLNDNSRQERTLGIGNTPTHCSHSQTFKT